MPYLRLAAVALAAVTVLCASLPAAAAQAAPTGLLDATPRIAVISAFQEELDLLTGLTEDRSSQSINGVTFTTGRLEGQQVVLFLSGISMVNAAMTSQLALDHFAITRIVFSGIAGGVDPALNIGDVVVAERWGQYLEVVMAREVEGGWRTPPFFTYPFANYGMMFPREVEVRRAGLAGPESRFWFPVDAGLLESARGAAAEVALQRCAAASACLEETPKVVIGGAGVSGGAFVDNADFRAYSFATFGARVLDMESAAVAHVAYANGVPFIAFRSLSDLAGGGDSEGENEIATFFQLAADNAAAVVRAFLAAIEP